MSLHQSLDKFEFPEESFDKTFWGFEGSFTNRKRIVYVDRKINEKELDLLERDRDSYHKVPGLKIIIYYDGTVEIPDKQEFAFEHKLIESFHDFHDFS